MYVFMLPTVFNELLMGINVRILNEILSLVEIKKKQFADGALFFLYGSLSSFTVYVGNKFLQHDCKCFFNEIFKR